VHDSAKNRRKKANGEREILTESFCEKRQFQRGEHGNRTISGEISGPEAKRIRIAEVETD